MIENRPNLFIVGAPKCGTSALAAYLEHHPDVFFCDPKEPFYWGSEDAGLRSLHGVHATEGYLKLFASARAEQSVIGEGSTNYLRSCDAIPRILDFNPNAQFIAMLRNPVEVVHAFHAELLFSYLEDEPCFESAWRLQSSRARGERIPKGCLAPGFLQYAEVASFATQIQRFYELVPESQRRVIVFDDFKADTAGVFEATQRFVGLDPVELESFPRVNAAHGHRSPLLARLVLDPPPLLRPFIQLLRGVARSCKGGVVDRVKMWMRRPQQRTPLSPEFRRELEQYFDDDVNALSGLLGRDLRHWTRGSEAPVCTTHPDVVSAKKDPVDSLQRIPEKVG